MPNPPWAKKWWIFAWSTPEMRSNLHEGKMVVDGVGIWTVLHGRLYVLIVRHLPGVYL